MCSIGPESTMNVKTPGGGITASPFGSLPDGRQVDLYALTNGNGLRVSIATYGGIVTSLTAPDRKGRPADIVLGFDNLDAYVAGHPYFGAIIGRYGNRIANGSFDLDGRTYTLARNNDNNHLHGGVRGFDKALWSAEPLTRADGPCLQLHHLSPDGDEGYPGNLDVTVEYTVTEENEVRIDYLATSDTPTHVNLTNHSYFNLGGAGRGNVLDHLVTLNADRFTPVDGEMIPTGELREVAGTPMDFRSPHAVGARIEDPDEQLELGNGYDHNFVLNRKGPRPTLAARVFDPKSGRVLEVFTTEPGVQFYSANFLDGRIKGKGGVVYGRRCALCLETQHFPNSPNSPEFPSTVLRPGDEHRSTTVYRFSCE